MEIDISEKTFNEIGQIRRLLGLLPQEVRDAALLEGMYRAAPIIVKRARRPRFGFSDDSGKLRKTIKRQSRRFKGSRYTNIIAGDRKSRAEGGVFYAHLVEFGIPAKGIPPRPFLERAAVETKGQFLQGVGNYVRNQGLQEAADKAKAKAGN